MIDIHADLDWRGLAYQSTEGIGEWLRERPRTVYAGFDPTADSLHAGSLLGLMYLRRLQKAGHRPLAIVGGATGMIGDPSGKSKERNLLSVDSLRANVVGIEKQMRQFLDFDSGDNAAVLVNNFDWMRKFSYLDFLRDIGKNVPVNMMLAKDSVKSRLQGESGMSYTEFSYMLLQAYDFVHLNQEYDCDLQVGGSDQWGNITAGIDLGRRMHGCQLHGMTWPLLTDANGVKMGKTEDGALWLDPDRTGPYEFYQYWYNVGDADVGKCLRYLTELPREEIESLDSQREDRPHERASQLKLAEEVTRTVHGESGVQTAKRASQALFGGAKIGGFDEATLLQAFADVPRLELPSARLTDGISLVDALVESGLCKSKGEARRTIGEGGAYVNNERMSEIEHDLTTASLATETVIVLRRGKKKYAMLKFV